MSTKCVVCGSGNYGTTEIVGENHPKPVRINVCYACYASGKLALYIKQHAE